MNKLSKGIVLISAAALTLGLAACGSSTNSDAGHVYFLNNKPEVVEALARQTTRNRVGFAEDIQGLTMFLASPASGYITGQVIHIDGGWTAI